MSESENVLAAQNKSTMALVTHGCMLVRLFGQFVFIASTVIAYIYRGDDPVLATHFNDVMSAFW